MQEEGTQEHIDGEITKVEVQRAAKKESGKLEEEIARLKAENERMKGKNEKAADEKATPSKAEKLRSEVQAGRSSSTESARMASMEERLAKTEAALQQVMAVLEGIRRSSRKKVRRRRECFGEGRRQIGLRWWRQSKLLGELREGFRNALSHRHRCLVSREDPGSGR